MTDEDRAQNDEASPVPDDDDTATVLELFGVRLQVRNARVAELLTMDAGEALGTDVRHLLGPAEIREARTTASEAVPDVLMAPPTRKDLADTQARADMRNRSDSIGVALGFDVGPGGIWESPTSISLITRVVERPVSYAAASDYVTKLVQVLADSDSPDATALFIVDSQQTADVFKVAIRQQRICDNVRTISAENLEAIRTLYGSGALDHARVLVLLTPIANADVGEILNIIRSAGEDEGSTRMEY